MNPTMPAQLPPEADPRARRWRLFRWVMLTAGFAAVVVGVVLFLWPLHGSGLSGNAIRPHYRPFGWVTTSPVPAHPSLDDLRRAGVAIPQDIVNRRSRIAGIVTGLIVAGLTLVCSSRTWRMWTATRRRRATGAARGRES